MKTKDEVLEQLYMTAKDLKILMPTVSIDKCSRYIEMIQAQMREKNLFVPETKPRLVLTKLVRKTFGI